MVARFVVEQDVTYSVGREGYGEGEEIRGERERGEGWRGREREGGDVARPCCEAQL